MKTYNKLIMSLVLFVCASNSAFALPIVTQYQYVSAEASQHGQNIMNNEANGSGNANIGVNADVSGYSDFYGFTFPYLIRSKASQSSNLSYSANGFSLNTDNWISESSAGLGGGAGTSIVSNYTATIVADTVLKYDWILSEPGIVGPSFEPTFSFTGINGDVLANPNFFAYGEDPIVYDHRASLYYYPGYNLTYEYCGLLDPGTYTLSINIAGSFIMEDEAQDLDGRKTTSFTVTAVPEPATLVLLGCGLVVVLAIRSYNRIASHPL